MQGYPPSNELDDAAIPVARPVVASATHPMALAESSPGSAAFDCVGFAVAAVLSTVLLAQVSAVFAASTDIDERIVVLAVTLVRAVILLGVLGVIIRMRGQSLASLGLCVTRWRRTALWGAAAGLTGFATLFVAVQLIVSIVPSAMESLQRNPQTIFEHLPRLHPAWLCLISAFVGFYEELIFRGFLLTRIRRALRSGVLGVLLSSALFAAAHIGTQENAVLFPVFCLGVVWAVFALRCRSVIPAAIGHGLFNSVQFLILSSFGTGWK